MQTSREKEIWKEDAGDEQARMRLRPEDAHLVKRRLYPISARLKEPSRIYPGVVKGHVFMYARTRMVPSAFPVEALFWHQSGQRQYMSFAPDEVELLGPQD